MGVVYKAEDTRLGRFVALKFLPDEVAHDAQALERFRREAKAASALNHPNICTIYDIGEIPPEAGEGNSGKAFIAMEYLDGVTLKHVISEQPLELHRLLDISAQIAQALAAAHSKNIIHRDIKPANIFISKSGQAKVLDFGLAKIGLPGEEDADFATGSLTQAGVAMGTLPYMSPEQLRGQRVDYRSDIFSMGAVIYEMATSQRPFMGNTSLELSSSILRDAPKSIMELRADLPAGLHKIVDRTLAKEPAERYSSARELHEAIERLRRELSTGSVGVSAHVASCEASIAVLPFTNMSTDPENEFFTDGITEEIINALTQIDTLRVAARSSAFSFKGKHVDLRIVGERLNVKTVLEGSVRKSGNRVRIVAQLVNVADGYHLWSERYDRELRDIFDVQDEISTAIANRLKVALNAEAQSPAKAPTTNLQAYQLYLKGRALLYRRGLDIGRAIKSFESAVALDPQYALAWAGLADARNMSGLYAFERPESVMPLAKDAANHAVALDPMLAEAQCALASISLTHDWNWKKAEAAFLRARELNPKYLQNLSWYALFYLVWTQGRFDEGIAVASQAVEYDPLSCYAHAMAAFAYSHGGKYKEAVREAEAANDLENSFFSHWVLQDALHRDGQFEKAVAAGEMALALSGRHAFAMSAQAMTFADWGKAGAAQALYAELVARASQGYVQPSQMAIAASAAGETEKAIAHLREAFKIRDPMIITVRYWPDFERLRQDSRFDEILVQMGLK